MKNSLPNVNILDFFLFPKEIALILGVCLTGFLQVSEAVECKDGDTFLPFPDDCSRYYACSNGVAYEQK